VGSLLLLFATIAVTVFTAGIVVPLLVGRERTEADRARHERMLAEELAAGMLSARR
jgi:hypothetical protein